MVAASVPRTLSIALLFALAGPALAQWDPYPSSGVPLTADGEPDLDGPPPRTFDGRIDFSGIWEHVNPPRGPVDGQLGRGPNTPVTPGSPPEGHFFDIGAQFDPPYTEWGDRITQERIDDGARGNPDAYCLPMGPILFHMHVQPRKMIQTRDLVLIVNEVNSGFRQIFLDGRKLPGEDAEPWWFGYSVGHWEGDTLVVETIALKEAVDQESAHSEGAAIVERYRLGSDDAGRRTLTAEVTLTDPVFYDQPVHATKVWVAAESDVEMLSYECTEPQWDEYLDSLRSGHGN